MLAAFLISLIILFIRFAKQNTVKLPAAGGSYVEGSVGVFKPLNPWFTITNDVNRDITSLVFSGLLKYNPKTKTIEEDLAVMEVSDDLTVYTLTLKDNLHWHDWSEENPHEVTADDVLFTYKTIQDDNFPNKLLQQNYQGVNIEKLDDKTVRFKLDEPYYFFPSNLTLGLLPARSFAGLASSKLDRDFSFGFNPVGAGPYKLSRITQTELYTEVTLDKFSEKGGSDYFFSQVSFRIFTDYRTLLSDVNNLSAIRFVPRDKDGNPVLPKNDFLAVNYTLPQYVALFLNTENDVLKEKILRLGIQLAINKQELADSIGERIIVDTPLLEIDNSDWRYQFDPAAAQGALHTSNWHLQRKLRLQALLEIREVNNTGFIKTEPVVLLDTGAFLTIKGSLVEVSTGATLNGLPLKVDATNFGTWEVKLPTKPSATGSLISGLNDLKLISENGKTLDTFLLWKTSDSEQFKEATTEQELVERFVKSRDGLLPSNERITVMDMSLENGRLRLKKDNDITLRRKNLEGKELVLKLLTSPSPPAYRLAAQNIKRQLENVGIGVDVVIPEDLEIFENDMRTRNYDMLLFGQSLLDNLDSYPYWHSSGIQENVSSLYQSRMDAYNLSQYHSLRADTLLELIRTTADKEERQQSLNELKDLIKEDIPAVFLYSPLYTFAYRDEIKQVAIYNLAMHSDKFSAFNEWYVNEKRVFRVNRNWFYFLPWLFSGGPMQTEQKETFGPQLPGFD